MLTIGRCFSAMLVLAFLSGAASAQSGFRREQIIRYEATLAVGRDASLTVTEVITVHARGFSIRRGYLSRSADRLQRQRRPAHQYRL